MKDRSFFMIFVQKISNIIFLILQIFILLKYVCFALVKSVRYFSVVLSKISVMKSSCILEEVVQSQPVQLHRVLTTGLYKLVQKTHN